MTRQLRHRMALPVASSSVSARRGCALCAGTSHREPRYEDVSGREEVKCRVLRLDLRSGRVAVRWNWHCFERLGPRGGQIGPERPQHWDADLRRNRRGDVLSWMALC